MMQDETESRATFEIVPDEVRMHIASYLDTQSLCFFAATSRRSLGNALAELKQRQQRMLAQMHFQARGDNTFCYTPQSLYACGYNEESQLGLGHKTACKQLTRVEDVPGTLLQVVASDLHTLVLTEQGLYACGYNEYGQLGLGHTNHCKQLTRVVDVPGTILQVVVGDLHTLVLTDQGLYACGYNKYGQLGLGHKTACKQLTRVEDVPGTLLQVAAGASYTLVQTDQGLYTCGNNMFGRLGLGHTNHCDQLTRIEENVPGTLLQVVVGIFHTFVQTDQGLYACGENVYGQLGLGHKDECNQLTRVVDVPGTILQVMVGESHTLVLTDQGLYACGYNGFGQLGLGHTNHCDQLTRMRIENVPGTLLQVVAGDSYTFVLTDQGLYACGSNACGELGLGHTKDCNQLTRLENVPGTILQVAAGDSHTFVQTDQGLYTCGTNRFGRLGLGLGHKDKCNQLTRVVDVPGTILQMVVSESNTLVLTDQGLYACGSNLYGQLCLGDEKDRHTFTLVNELPVELKQWLSQWRQLNHLIAFSTREVTDERDEPEALLPSTKRAGIG